MSIIQKLTSIAKDTMPEINGSTEPAAATSSGSRQEVFVGSIDQGTTSSRFLIFNRDGEPVASHQIEFKQYYPNPG
jgi:hypothetical protein